VTLFWKIFVSFMIAMTITSVGAIYVTYRIVSRPFTQTDFEDAAFFGSVDATRELEAGEAYMQSAGRSQGQFSFARGQRGQFVQTGLSAR
jgi:hypothetical protein